MFQSDSVRGLAPRAALAALLCAPLVLLTACGGGGDGSPADAPLPQANLVITSANAKPVSADALDNATNTDTAERGTAFVPGVQIDASAGGSTSLQLASAARLLAAKVSGRTSLATGVAFEDSAPCMSGTVNFSGNVANPNVVSPGDTVTLTANACQEPVDGTTMTMNGTLKITILATGSTHMAMAMEAVGFSVSGNGRVNQTAGDMSIDVTTGVGTEAIVISGSSLSTSVTTAAGTRSFTLRNYRQAVSVVNGASSYTVDATVSSQNSRLGTGAQVYTVSTPTPLAANASGALTAGSLKVTGASSALLLTVNGTDTFQLQVDANGDGTYETTTTATRAELRALL